MIKQGIALDHCGCPYGRPHLKTCPTVFGDLANSEPRCDCHLHKNQVCDICQHVKSKDGVPIYRDGKLNRCLTFADLIRAMSEDLEALRELHRAVAKAHEQAAKEGK